MNTDNKTKYNNISRREFLIASAAVTAGAIFQPMSFASESGKSFRFAVTSDIHMYIYNLESGAMHTEFRDYVCDDVLAHNPGDFMILTGDLDNFKRVNDTVQDKLIAALAAKGKSYHAFYVVGNHDIYHTSNDLEVQQWPYKGRENTDRLREYHRSAIPQAMKDLSGAGNLRWGPRVSTRVLPGYENEVNGRLGSEETNYSFDYKNCHFVVIDEYFGNGYKTPEGTYPARGNGNIIDQLYSWLEADLSANKQRFTLVFGHEPVWQYIYHDKSDDGNSDPVLVPGKKSNFMAKNSERFWALLAKHKVNAYFCGHTHAYGATQHNGIWQIVTPSAMASWWGWNAVNVYENKITCESYRYKPGGTPVKEIRDTGMEYKLIELKKS